MKPSLPKGTRDFGPAQLSERKYITDILRQHFELFGYQPIETPSFENLSTLTGKYGDEGDRLIFKILNSGDFLKKVPESLFQSLDAAEWVPKISEKALRYDLTVPFARFVVINRNELEMPFRRYQIQNVWRADRPQKGRFREFVQCDADVVGSDSLMLEVELALLYDRVFAQLGLKGCTIKINNRKILSALAQASGIPKEGITGFTTSLDKLDKIGAEAVAREWEQQGVSSESVKRLLPLLESSEEGRNMLEEVRPLIVQTEEGRKGLEEVDWVFDSLAGVTGLTSDFAFDLTLARGLNYYTGCIFEVSAPDPVEMGSIGGGGRYDNLTGIFGLPGVSGVGISFGLDRIQLVMKELDLFPSSIRSSADLLLSCMDSLDLKENPRLAERFRAFGIKAECYPDNHKLPKQFKYADRKGIPFLLLRGEEEKSRNTFTLKNLSTGDQREFPEDQVTQALQFMGIRIMP